VTFRWQKAQILNSHKSADTHVLQKKKYFIEFHKLHILLWGCCEGGKEISCFLKGKKVLDDVLHCQFLRTASTPYTYRQLSTE
jgi:hypothetical protein